MNIYTEAVKKTSRNFMFYQNRDGYKWDVDHVTIMIGLKENSVEKGWINKLFGG